MSGLCFLRLLSRLGGIFNCIFPWAEIVMCVLPSRRTSDGAMLSIVTRMEATSRRDSVAAWSERIMVGSHSPRRHNTFRTSLTPNPASMSGQASRLWRSVWKLLVRRNSRVLSMAWPRCNASGLPALSN